VIANRLESVRKLVNKLGPVGRLRACYEAGPTGCVLYGQLTQLGVACEVIAPSLVPTKAGDRVKIDHRDATTGALLRAGELTAVWVPDASHEALRDLVRAPRSGEKGSNSKRGTWTQKHREWINSHVHFDQPQPDATPPVEVMAGATTVLTVQGSLRRAKMRRVLDGCAPLRPDGGCDGAALAGTIPEPARPNPIKRAGLLLAEEAGLTTNPSNYVGPDRSLHIRS
jgi:hypothetical protein